MDHMQAWPHTMGGGGGAWGGGWAVFLQLGPQRERESGRGSRGTKEVKGTV